MKKNNRFIIGILIISVICNLIVLKVDIIPFVAQRIEKKYSKNQGTIKNVKFPEKIILNRSLEMANSTEIFTVFDEQSSFSEGFLRMLGYSGHNDLFKRYNYPRAYLISGITDYARSVNDTTLMLQTAKIFDKYINDDGSPSFILDKVDQVPFGIAAINLFNYSNNIKYKKFANYIYNYIRSTQQSNSIVLYRNNRKEQLYDVIGMICPFLVRYEEISKDGKSLKLSFKQLEYYNKYGVDKETFLPCHGINLKTNIKVGSTNWGRGIGWYIIGLSEYVRIKGEGELQLDGLINSLEQLKTNDSVWTQFPGSDTHFDASATTMFMYAINLAKPGSYSKKEIFKTLSKYIREDGTIMSTSGDTHDINRYSKTYGDSELSQGMLLMLLSTTTK